MLLLASLLCLSPLLAHIYCEDVVGIMGENFTFPVQIDKKIVEAIWKKNKDKVAEWEEQNEPTYYHPLHNRSVLMENGSLTIVNLEKGDAGTYELQYWDYVADHTLYFALSVLDPLPEPKISCNTSNDELVLKCTANFQRSVNYFWKLSNNPHSYENQELSIALENVDTTTSATCTIKFSQTERRSEILLVACLPEGKGDHSQKRHRYYIIAAIIVVGVLVGIPVLLHRKGIIKLGTGRRTAQNNSAVNGSGEHEKLFPGNSQQQANSQEDVVLTHGSEPTEVKTIDESESEKMRSMAAFSHTVDCGNEEPEADRALNRDMNKEDKQTVKNGVSQEEVTQDTEDGNGRHPGNSSSCTIERS